MAEWILFFCAMLDNILARAHDTIQVWRAVVRVLWHYTFRDFLRAKLFGNIPKNNKFGAVFVFQNWCHKFRTCLFLKFLLCRSDADRSFSIDICESKSIAAVQLFLERMKYCIRDTASLRSILIHGDVCQ